MKSKLENLPCYSQYRAKLDAPVYNCIKLAQLRHGKGRAHALRLQLAELRHLDLIIDDETWICVDRDQNDIPILAWLNFDTQHRQELHKAIACDIYSYHAYAEMIEQRVLKYAVKYLQQSLQQARTETSSEPTFL